MTKRWVKRRTKRSVPPTMSMLAARASVRTSVLDDVNLLHEILFFLGRNQYRFVAAVNRNFHTAYLHAFSNNTRTSIDVSTIRHTKICREDMMTHPLWHWHPDRLLESLKRHGYFLVLRYLFIAKCKLGDTCASAAANGHLHLLQCAPQFKCPWDRNTCAEAARNGHLHILKWAREHKCPWDKKTCARAAENGHMHVLMWARENGCP
jgi:hypothetical protein